MNRLTLMFSYTSKVNKKNRKKYLGTCLKKGTALIGLSSSESWKKWVFSQKWTRLSFKCISTTSFQVLTNGTPVRMFTATWRLRLDDSLSLYLFILCTKGLLANLWSLENWNIIKGVRIKSSSPAITHLLFVDDCYIFCKAQKEEA